MSTHGTRRLNARQIRKLGSLVVLQFYLTSKLHSMYGPEHRNTLDASDAFCDRVFSFCEAIGRLTIRSENAPIVVNHVRLRRDPGTQQAVEWLARRFRDSGLAALTFLPSVSAEELRASIPVINDAVWLPETPPPPIAAQLREAGVHRVIVRMRRFRDEQRDQSERVEVSSRLVAIAIYRRLQQQVRHFVECVRDQRPLALRDAKLFVQHAADLLADRPDAMMCTLAVRPTCHEDEYLVRHMTNVCLLSLAMGIRLGMQRRHLIALGCAALVYDAGMVRVPLRYRASNNPLPPQAQPLLHAHPLWVVRALLASGERSPHTFAIAVLVGRHHNGSGYPRRVEAAHNLCTEVLMLVDRYDALVSPRPWRDALSQDHALEQLYRSHDPSLVKVLANVIGVYPVGTLVALDTGEIGVVSRLATCPGARLDRPFVKLLLDAAGRNIDGEEVDLNVRDSDGNHLRSIARILPSDPVELQVEDLLALM